MIHHGLDGRLRALNAQAPPTAEVLTAHAPATSINAEPLSQPNHDGIRCALNVKAPQKEEVI